MNENLLGFLPMRDIVDKFWDWYERNLLLNTGIAALLFVWQILHLIWLGGDVVFAKLFGLQFFGLEGFWQKLIVLVDYTEIPAIISVSLLYIHDLRKGFNYKSFWYLIFLNSQWLHIFWITDEFVVSQFLHGQSEPLTILPLWLAWLAIAIDYLELPVMYDTIKRFLTSLFSRRVFAKKKI